MNLYCLVEGRRTEKRVYRAWISYVFPQLKEISRIEDATENSYYLISGNGYPSYRSRITAALDDITQCRSFDEFIICVDAEQHSVAEKTDEISQLVLNNSFFKNTHIIVHNCCIETWFLGHTKMLKRNPHSKMLRQFKAFYDVSSNDPEQMGYPAEYEMCASFHYQYLKEMLREKGLRYTKLNPGPVREKHYLESLVERHTRTGHLGTFGNLLQLWRSWGGNI